MSLRANKKLKNVFISCRICEDDDVKLKLSWISTMAASFVLHCMCLYKLE